MLKIKFRAFRAVDEPQLCEKFIEGHRKVLEIYDIAMITSNKALWASHANTYVILAEAEDSGKALGGARLQIADDVLPLPIQDAVGQVDANIYNIVAQRRAKGTGEVCGLWNSREIAGFGVGSIFLTRAIIAIAFHKNLGSLLALCAPATVKVAARAGFEIERSLGKDGFFNYPKINLVATAMIIDNLYNLETARQGDRDSIKDLIDNQVQIRVERGPKGKVEIDYRLALTH